MACSCRHLCSFLNAATVSRLFAREAAELEIETLSLKAAASSGCPLAKHLELELADTVGI